MTTVLDESGRDLARRVESGWARLGEASALAYGRLRPGADVAVLAVAGGLAVSYGPGSPLAGMLSQAQGMGLAGAVLDSDLDRLQAFYGDREKTHSVEVATLADPGFLPALARRGYRPTETTHMLARRLGPEDVGLHSAEGGGGPMVVPGVGPNAPLTADVVTRGFFDGPGEPPEGLGEVMIALTAAPGSSSWLALVASEAGPTPVGGASLFVAEGLAFLAGDATLPAFRGLGAQRALIQARLAEAARLGCALAVACAQPGSVSQRNYERQGFRLIFARVLMTLEA